MSYVNFLSAINLLDLNSRHYSAIIPQSEENIKSAEGAIELKFPETYKLFLKQFGSLDISSQSIFGLTNNNDFSQYLYENIVCNVKEIRQDDSDPRFPHYLIPIHALGNGELSCLDTSQMNDQGECPVVAWYFGATLPNGKFEVLAEDFGAFFLEKVIWGLESLEEDGEEIDWGDFKK